MLIINIFLFSQSLQEDVRRQMERERELQIKYAKLREELEQAQQEIEAYKNFDQNADFSN